MPKKTSEIWEIEGRDIQVTSLDKLYWPDDGLTKGDALGYYRQMAETMLPYLRKRPLTFRVFPRGTSGPGYWRREQADSTPDWLRSVAYQPGSQKNEIQVPLIDDVAGLIWQADHSAIEFHQWLSRADKLERPDWAVFDLDPGEDVAFAQVLEAAVHVRDALSQSGLTAFAKTSGGVGLHLFVPLERRQSYEDAREWVHRIATKLADQYPELIATASGGTHRGARVTIDHAQNSIARNTIAPYSLRARPGAPVSTPLNWDEVESGMVRPEQFTLRTVPQRVEKDGDPWADALKLHQRLRRGA
ncbi:MAG TPA: non-homologous end-joining DNA ligase [Nitrolancea sp.]|jgi:bifunctional non-homologous end joining protein LigD|nr:non-homologous end-joining DNA ligase [Nitrolancea sp.]